MLKITLHVSAELAIKAGSTQIGSQTLTITDAQLKELTPMQRDTLARHVGDHKFWRETLTMHAERIAVADMATLASLLDQRRAWALEQEAQAARELEEQRELEAKHARMVEAALEPFMTCPVANLLVTEYSRPTLRTVYSLVGPGLYEFFQKRNTLKWTIAEAVGRLEEAEQEIERLEYVRERDEHEKTLLQQELHAAAKRRIVDFLHAQGYHEQAERAEADVLPVDELEQIAESVLFAGLGEPWVAERTTSRRSPTDGMTAQQWQRWRELEQASLTLSAGTIGMSDVTINRQTCREWQHCPSHEDADDDGDILAAEYEVAVICCVWNELELERIYKLD